MENEKADFISSLDRRVTDHDGKISQGARDLTQLSLEIKQLLERINQGLSPSVNAVRQENSEIKLAIQELTHKLEIRDIDMKAMVRESTEHTRSMIANFEKSSVEPIQREVSFIKKTFIYGLVGAGIVFLGERAMGVVWEKFFSPRADTIIAENLHR